MKQLRLAAAFAALVILAPALSACHTTAGVGQDLSSAGHEITHDANHDTPR